jgi:putative ABC transport system permease protein
MLLNYLKSALRATRRRFGYTAINVVGLAVGIAVCLLITLFVRHELSYDRFHADAEQIYRLTADWGEVAEPGHTWPTIRTMRDENPSLTIAPFFEARGVVTRATNRFNERVFVAKPAFFDVFTFPVARGTAKDALEEPYTAVVTPSIAEKYFGDANPVGQTLTMKGLQGQGQEVTVTVGGVLEPIPEASHFHPQIILSWATFDAAYNFSEERRNAWGNNGYRAYLKVPDGSEPEVLADRFMEQAKARAGEDWNGATLGLQPLTRIHLHSNLNNEIEPTGSATYVYLFAAVALFVLVLACVNFVNLATARATERAREVGVRKSVGAHRGQLVGQFMAEAFVLSVAALGLAVALAAAALPLFRRLTEIDFPFGILADPFTIGALLVITIVATLGAGGYPAFVLSRFEPAAVLSASSPGGSTRGGGSPVLRKGLVVFQFATAVVLIAGTVVAYWQLDYLQDASLGFDQEQVLTLPEPPTDATASAAHTFLTAAEEQPGVTAVARASDPLPSEPRAGNAFVFDAPDVPEDQQHILRVVAVDHRFFGSIGVKPIAGRTFQRGRGTDSSAVVLNRTAYDLLAGDLPAGERAPSKAIGRTLDSGWPVDDPTMIGVVEDFHFRSLRQRLEPVAFFLAPRNGPGFQSFYLRVDATQAEQVLSRVEGVWRNLFPEAPFQYTFADQAFAASYRAEQRLGTLFSVFAGLAVFIACLGLLGLAAFTARQRTKEIGIRKALGASSRQIVQLLSKDFAGLVAGAVVVAVPVAYVVLQQWLSTFAYHIDLGVGVFVLAGGGALLVALLTVSTQAFRAARTDPAEVLRSE